MSFKTFQAAFENLLGSDPTIYCLLERDWAFAHEAGVFIADRNELFITSSLLTSDTGDKRIQISVVEIDKPARATASSVKITCKGIHMPNGGVNYQKGILFCDQGNMTAPSGLYHTSITPPYETRLLISNFHGRPFNSVNDVVAHSDGSIWFTDPTYGYEQGFRPPPRLPSQVYRFNPADGSVRAIADGFGHPNGLCFSPDETTMYVTDTDWIRGDGTTDETKASTIYAFDILDRAGQPFLVNRRLFSMCDTGIPDGIKCDMEGNVYSGCGDGVNIWSAGGVLIGKILIEGGVANFCFGRGGELFLLNEARLWRVQLDEHVKGALLGI